MKNQTLGKREFLCLELIWLITVFSPRHRSYVSAIKHILTIDGYDWNDDKVLLTVLVRACKLVNDQIRMRLPIQIGMFEMLLFEIQRLYSIQPYLCRLYQALFAMAYYGLMRMSEITVSPHACRACNIHIRANKNKLLIILYSLKTHSKANPPQKIKIMEKENAGRIVRNFCPFGLVRSYTQIRGDYLDETEQFFVFADHSAGMQSAVRLVLNKLIMSIDLNPKNYGFHSLRSGRCLDLLKFRVPLETIKRIGRWRLNAVYKYLCY